MKTFKDSATGEIYAYEDDVVVKISSSGVSTAFTSTGVQLKTAPKTLQPYTVPAPTTAQKLAAAKTAQIAVIRQAAQTALVAPMSFTNAAGTTSSFPMSDRDVSRYHLAYTNYVLGGVALPTGLGFYDVNLAPVPFTVADIKAFFEAGVSAGDVTLQKEASLIAQINAATTQTAVKAVTW